MGSRPAEKSFKCLCIFGIGAGKNGQSTAMFYSVKDFSVFAERMTFSYESVSTGRQGMRHFICQTFQGSHTLNNGN